MPKKMEFERRGTVGEISPIRGTSMELNTQKQCGGEKPAFTGEKNPGGFMPPMEEERRVPLPTGGKG